MLDFTALHTYDSLHMVLHLCLYW